MVAERTHWWIERWLECRAICLSIYLSIYLFIYLIYRSICLSICFAPQRRALLEHINFQTCSEPKGVFNVLVSKCASRHSRVACSTSQLPTVLRQWCVFGIFTSNLLRATAACNCSSLISPDGSAPAALASPPFDPPQPQNIGKTQCFATFLPLIAPGSSFTFLFWPFLFSDLLSSSFSYFFFLSLL